VGKSKKNRNKPAPAETSRAAAAAPARKLPILPITIGVAAVIIVIAIAAGSGAQSVQFVDGKASRTIATVDECQFTTIAVTLPADQTPEEAAAGIFDALSKTPRGGVGLVSVYKDDPRVEIDYCQSYTSEPELRAALAEAGYLAE